MRKAIVFLSLVIVSVAAFGVYRVSAASAPGTTIADTWQASGVTSEIYCVPNEDPSATRTKHQGLITSLAKQMENYAGPQSDNAYKSIYNQYESLIQKYDTCSTQSIPS